MPSLQSLRTSAHRQRLRRILFLLLGLIPGLQFPSELARAASVSIQMSNPACVQVLPERGTCSIEIGSLTASGSDQTFSRLEVLVDGKLRVYMGGFFESSAFLFYRMMPGGLKVACGRPNDGGLPNYGRSYLLSANAYMADGTSASNSMTVFCPAYDGKTFLPLIER
jgi:hypothetical protein